MEGFGTFSEVKKMTPRQIHAAIHHIQIIRRQKLADLTRVTFMGAQADQKSIDRFLKDLARDV